MPHPGDLQPDMLIGLALIAAALLLFEKAAQGIDGRHRKMAALRRLKQMLDRPMFRFRRRA